MKEMETRDPMAEMTQLRDPGEKQQQMFEAKKMMGMSYNAMRRDVAERSRGSSVEGQVFTGAANVYQPALDVAQIDPTAPLGTQRGGEATMSFGAARMMEAFGSQSAMGGNLLKSLTGGSQFEQQRKSWEQTDEGWQRKMEGPGYSAQFTQLRGSGIQNLQTTIRQTAMFTGEVTPGQMSAMLTGRESPETEQAIREARTWAGGQKGKTAQYMMASPQGAQHMGNIMRAAGLEDIGEFMRSEAPLPQALMDKAMIRAGTQIERGLAQDPKSTSYDWHKKEYAQLEQMTQEHLGMSPEQRITEAKQRQAAIDIRSGKTGTLPGGDPITALSRQDLGYATQGITLKEQGQVMSGPMDWAQEWGVGDEPPPGHTEEAEEIPISGGGGGRRPPPPSTTLPSPSRPSPQEGSGGGGDMMAQIQRMLGIGQQPQAKSMGYLTTLSRMFQGEKGLLTGRQGMATMRELGTGQYHKGKTYEWDLLQKVGKWLKKPGQEAPGWLRGVGRDMAMHSQIGSEDEIEGMGEGYQKYKRMLVGDERTRSQFTKSRLDPTEDALVKFSDALKKSTDMLGALEKSGTSLSNEQKSAIEKFTQADLRTSFKKALKEEGPQFLEYKEAQEAMRQLGMGGGGEDGPQGMMGAVMGGAGRVLKKATSGFGMFAMSRMWGLTGAPAIRAQQTAMTEEMSVQRAQASWGGGGQLGPVSQGLLGIQAQQNLSQVRMGRSAYMAYGGVQRGLAGGIAGEMAGIAGPAAGAGLIGGYLMGGPVGLGIGAATAAYGMGQYTKAIGQDPNEMAVRATGNIWEKMTALGGGVANEGKFGGIFNYRNWGSYLGKQLTAEGRAETEDIVYRGRDIRAGRMDVLDSGGQAAALRQWSETQAGDRGIMKAENWAEMAGQWQAYSGDVENLYEDLPAELMQKMAVRGVGVGQAAQLATGMGGMTSDFETMAQFMVNQPNQAAMSRGMQQVSPLLQRFGIPGGDLGQYLETANFQELNPYQERQAQGLASGNRLLMSQYAAGGLNLAPGVQAIMPEAQPWMQTMEAQTGLPLHTTTGGLYSGNYGALSTQAAQGGGLRGIAWDQMQSQFGYSRWQEGQQLNNFQMGQVMQTGQQMPGMGGQAPGGFAQLAQSMGGMWGIQDAQRGLAADWQQYQFGFQQQRMDVGNRQWGENWQANWDKFQTQKGWQDEDYSRQQERTGERDEFWMTRWNYQENRAQQQYGWGMEDVDESIRFATGRSKLRLQRQKERATITESGRREFHDAEKENWEQEKEWRDEDFERAQTHREQINEWREEDLIRQKEHHDENSKMAQGNFDKTKEHYAAEKKLQENQIKLTRAYWMEQQKAQAQQIEKAQEQAELQRQLREDQWKLTVDAQDAVAKFQVMWNELGNDMTTALQDWNAEVERFKDQMGGGTASTGGTSDEWRGSMDENYQRATGATSDQWFHDGGPVGKFSDDVSAVLQKGEYVVPRSGALVQKDDDRVVTLLTRIADTLDAGNGRFTIMVQNPGETAKELGNVYNAAFSY